MGFVYNVTKGRTEYLIGLDEGGAGGGGVSKKKIIIKSDTIPEASAKTYKLIYIYAGESNGTYHHGYIYECIADVTYDAKNIYFDSHNMGFDYRNADPSKNFTTDGEAMEAFLELVLRDKDVSFLQVTNGALTRKETGMWNVQLKDKDGNILLDNYQLGPEDLEDFGFVFLQQQSAYIVGEPEDFNFVWEQTSISNYHWNRLDVQPGSSGGTTDYADLTNKPQINGNTLVGNKTSNQLELQNMSIEVQNSGDTLPADTTGYNLGDKFLNKTDKKVYEVGNEYELNSNTNTSGLTINYTTGEVSGFGSGKYIYRNYTDGWLGNKNFIVKFKLDTISSGGLIAISRRVGVSSPSDINIAFGIYTDNKIYYSKYSASGSSYTEIENKLLFDIVLSANNEYVLNINKHGEICNVELLLNNTIIATNSFNTEDLTQYSINAIRFGNFYLNNNNYYLTTGSIYLLESSGDFLTPTGNVVWDNGTALVDNTQYIDITNDILWLYNDNKLIQLNSLVATINFYDINNWTLDVTKTQLTVTGTLGNSVYVFKNGQLIQGGSGNDYTVSGNVITFTTALEDTDKVAVINGNLTGIDLTPYLTASDLVPYQQKAQIVEDDRAQVTSLAIQANKVYKLTNANITEISFASCEQSELVTKIDFTTGATAPQFSDGNSIDWADGETPHFYAYQHYWIIISDKVGFVKEIY